MHPTPKVAVISVDRNPRLALSAISARETMEHAELAGFQRRARTRADASDGRPAVLAKRKPSVRGD